MTGKPLTDAELGEKASNLGALVQAFAEKHYGRELSQAWEKGTNKGYRKYLELTTPESPQYRAYLADPIERPKVIGGFIWRVLIYEVFECFHWLGRKPGRNFRQLREQLRPVERDGLDAVQYKRQRQGFNGWSTASLQLLCEDLDRHSDDERDVQADYKQHRIKYVAKNTLAVTGRGRIDIEDIQKDLIELIDAAWALDISLTQDFREFSWIWGTQPLLTHAREEFNPSTDSGWDNKQPRDKRGNRDYVRLVCSPALVKTIGEKNDVLDENSQVILLKRLVSVTPSTDPEDEGLSSSLKTKLSFNFSRAGSPTPSPRPGSALEAARSSEFEAILDVHGEEAAATAAAATFPPPARARNPGPLRSATLPSATGVERGHRPQPLDFHLPLRSRRFSASHASASSSMSGTPPPRDNRPSSASGLFKKNSPFRSFFRHKPGADLQ